VQALGLGESTGWVKIIGRCRGNILEPREIYELTGQVPNVVFPSGMITEKTDSQGFALPDSGVKIYYGAADTVTGLAVTSIQLLLTPPLRNKPLLITV
jgi:beta-1,4-mannooligosaccharide/beta-1,4-mannosyl-N-acetylglucosamine phosphorylase